MITTYGPVVVTTIVYNYLYIIVIVVIINNNNHHHHHHHQSCPDCDFWWSIWNHLPTGSSIWIYARFIRTLRGGALDLHEWLEWLHDTSMELVHGGHYKPIK